MKASSFRNGFFVFVTAVAICVVGTVIARADGELERVMVIGSRSGVHTVQQAEVIAQLATPCSNDLDAAISCFGSKEPYARVLIPDAITGDLDKSNLLVIARFLGEIRSRRIPDYHELPRSGNFPSSSVTVSGTNVFNPQSSTDPEVKKACEKAVAEWQFHNKTFELQQELSMSDVNLTPRLLEACSQLSTNDSANVTLLKQVSEAAHLTENERKKLGLPGP
jgi:hypothetical protein